MNNSPLLSQLSLQFLDVFLSFLLLQSNRLSLLILNSLLLSRQLIRSSDRNVLWFVVAECGLQHLFDNITTEIIDDHGDGHSCLEFGSEGYETHLLIDLGDEFGGARESNRGNTNDSPIHASVFCINCQTLSNRLLQKLYTDLIMILGMVDLGN
jgi:hypothetical protein